MFFVANAIDLCSGRSLLGKSENACVQEAECYVTLSEYDIKTVYLYRKNFVADHFVLDIRGALS